MREFDTIEAAKAHPGIVHIESGAIVRGYEAGDALPTHLIVTPSNVPPEVTMRQARLALLTAGLLSAVDTAINAMSEPAKSAARIEWEYSGAVRRHQPLVVALGPALGLSSAQIDDLFILAATL